MSHATVLCRGEFDFKPHRDFQTNLKKACLKDKCVQNLSGDSVSEIWKRAVAYLKPKVTDGGPEAAKSVSIRDSPVLRDLQNGLLVAYLVDEGTGFSYVQNQHLSTAGIEEDTLHATAVNNLYGLAARHLRIQPYGSVFAVFMEGNFEASVLLLDTVWDVSLAKHVAGDFLAVAPARDVLAFGDSSSPEAAVELRAIIERVKSTTDHALSDSVFRRSNGGWFPQESLKINTWPTTS